MPDFVVPTETRQLFPTTQWSQKPYFNCRLVSRELATVLSLEYKIIYSYSKLWNYISKIFKSVCQHIISSIRGFKPSLRMKECIRRSEVAESRDLALPIIGIQIFSFILTFWHRRKNMKRIDYTACSFSTHWIESSLGNEMSRTYTATVCSLFLFFSPTHHFHRYPFYRILLRNWQISGNNIFPMRLI